MTIKTEVWRSTECADCGRILAGMGDGSRSVCGEAAIVACLRITVARLRRQLYEKDTESAHWKDTAIKCEEAMRATYNAEADLRHKTETALAALVVKDAALRDTKSRLRKELEYRERSEAGLLAQLARYNSEPEDYDAAASVELAGVTWTNRGRHFFWSLVDSLERARAQLPEKES